MDLEVIIPEDNLRRIHSKLQPLCIQIITITILYLEQCCLLCISRLLAGRPSHSNSHTPTLLLRALKLLLLKTLSSLFHQPLNQLHLHPLHHHPLLPKPSPLHHHLLRLVHLLSLTTTRSLSSMQLSLSPNSPQHKPPLSRPTSLRTQSPLPLNLLPHPTTLLIEPPSQQPPALPNSLSIPILSSPQSLQTTSNKVLLIITI